MTTRRRIPRSSFTRIRRAALAVIVSVAATSLVVPTTASAKLRSSEKTFLRELLVSVFDRTPTATSLNCIANRLPAGAIEDLLVDGLLTADDPTLLAESIPFRKVYRSIFLCKPTELQATLASSFAGSGLTLRQRNCIARAFMGRVAFDDDLLTFSIRSGLRDGDGEPIDDFERLVLLRNLVVSVQPCVPRAVSDAIVEELLLAF